MGAQWKQKGRVAAADAKGRVFTKLAKEIMIAAIPRTMDRELFLAGANPFGGDAGPTCNGP
jgi:hypothetical protein